MSRLSWGIALRLTGPLIQCLGLICLFLPGSDSQLVGQLSFRRLGVLLFVIGMVLVAVGLGLSFAARRAASPKNRPIEPLHLD